MQIVEIIEVGPGWNKVRLGDGNVYTLDGNYSWRSNNPGNIEYGDFARSMGAIGEGAVPPGRSRGFAIFPTLEAGQHAREVLQFETPGYTNANTNERWGHNYPDGSIGAAIYRYAPPTENDTEGYIRAVTSAAGVTPETMMRDLTPEQRSAFMEAQQHHEGWRQGDVLNEAGVKLPPEEIPNVVGSELATDRGSIADRTNAALDRLPPVPAPRSQGTGARVNAEFDRPRPASMSPELAAQRNGASDVPMPQPRPDRPDVPPGLESAPGLGGNGNQPQRLLPVIGPTGTPAKANPVGTMPSRAEVAGLGRTATPSRPVPSGGLVERNPAPVAPRSVTRTGDGLAGTVQMEPGARPAVADQLVQSAETTAAGRRPVPSGGLVERAPPAAPPAPTRPVPSGGLVERTPPAAASAATPPQPVPSGGLVGQDAGPARTASPATAASPAEVPKYIVTEKKVPLGDTLKPTSRDSVELAAAGKKFAESEAFRTIKTTSLNPEWVEQQRQQQATTAPGLGTPAAPAAPGGGGLGQGATPAGAPQLIYGTSTGRAYEVGKVYSNGNGSAIAMADGTFKRVKSEPETDTATVERPSSKAPTNKSPSLLERIRTSIGLPAEGIAPSFQQAIGLGGGGSGNANSTKNLTNAQSSSTGTFSKSKGSKSGGGKSGGSKGGGSSSSGSKPQYDHNTGTFI